MEGLLAFSDFFLLHFFCHVSHQILDYAIEYIEFHNFMVPEARIFPSRNQEHAIPKRANEGECCSGATTSADMVT